ncbi:MAG: aminoacyl-tRNA hydrolase [Actinobacteria bacterium]|nr:aminoacyl-tRNA hydrolase [Actinomycetota bacterium]
MFRSGEGRRGTPAHLLVVGLGNPGSQYAGTRHNVGADVVALLAERHGGRLRPAKRERALADEVTLGPERPSERGDGPERPSERGDGTKRLALAFPQTFMNDSGVAVAALVRRYGIEDPARLVVVHDELDLPPGRVRVKEGGGLAGHNGLRSIKAHLKTDAFLRVRIGIGKPPGRQEGVGHVLARPSKSEREELAVAIEEAADAVEMIATEGVARAMNRFNASAPS